MKLTLKKFVEDDAGAVTVDWVVLTAAIVGLGTSAIITAKGGISGIATKISTSVSGMNVGS
ncbi:hypothetical protein K1T73_03915 [Roseovarius sp. SCSIO 43702]|uniref:hypothetical protein n=1 Tax=Roseovarius sp. SCSIO 43702 TaxID=2823043 RepID=UPI001C737381|nr:hypothetical protein [Roseovarius sp. SCSIO 43702]QYX57556.1 hypothetical protein K1T73_03915 [Roseovarius sp. SCSIO 43702]